MLQISLLLPFVKGSTVRRVHNFLHSCIEVNSTPGPRFSKLYYDRFLFCQSFTLKNSQLMNKIAEFQPWWIPPQVLSTLTTMSVKLCLSTLPKEIWLKAFKKVPRNSWFEFFFYKTSFQNWYLLLKSWRVLYFPMYDAIFC